jgi:hypothetical protein
MINIEHAIPIASPEMFISEYPLYRSKLRKAESK